MDDLLVLADELQKCGRFPQNQQLAQSRNDHFSRLEVEKRKKHLQTLEVLNCFKHVQTNLKFPKRLQTFSKLLATFSFPTPVSSSKLHLAEQKKVGRGGRAASPAAWVWRCPRVDWWISRV